jgi:hypothetical protein
MTISKKMAVIVGIVLVLLFGILCKIAYEQHKAIASADQVSKADQDKIDDFNLRISKRSADDLQQRVIAEQQQTKVKTSADAVKIITKYVPVPTLSLDQPSAAFVVDKQAFTPEEAQKLPESPNYVVQTEEQSTLVAKELIACQADRQTLNSCKANMADMASAAALQKQQVDTWKAAAKGGTKTQRFLKVLKCAGFAGVGAAGGAFTKQPLWAGVGATAGVAACQLF